MTLPNYVSKLSAPVIINNFTPIQSAQLAAGTGTGAANITFTLVPGGATRTTFKIWNNGDVGAYIATGIGSATAVVSSATPTPASSVPNAAATCDFVGPGGCLTQDYVAGTDTIAAITASGSTTLEISIGYGQ